MKLLHWRFAVLLGGLGAILEAFSVALLAYSRTTWSGIVSLFPYAFFLAAILYLVLTLRGRWWMITVATLAVAWVLMVALATPAMLIATWATVSKPDTYFVVSGGWDDWLLLSAAGVAGVAVLTTIIGGLARLVFRSSAA